MKVIIIMFLIMLIAANLFLLVALNSGKGNQTKETKLGIRLVSVISVCNVLSIIGGVILW